MGFTLTNTRGKNHGIFWDSMGFWKVLLDLAKNKDKRLRICWISRRCESFVDSKQYNVDRMGR